MMENVIKIIIYLIYTEVVEYNQYPFSDNQY